MPTSPETLFSVLTIVAIFTGPIAAIQIQVYLERKREERRRKVAVFRELMITRAAVLSPRHVEALNAIQMEFSSKDPAERQALDAWQLYINHLSNPNRPDATTWNAQGPELLTDLLFKIATCLRFHDLNKARIKAEGYIPKYFVEIEKEQNELRKSAVEVFSGRQPLNVNVTENQPVPAAAPNHSRFS